jgi:pimeloyl-ACP methyl ester carboxylesterase
MQQALRNRRHSSRCLPSDRFEWRVSGFRRRRIKTRDVGKNPPHKFVKPIVGISLKGFTASLAAAVGLALAGCAGSPLVPFSTDTPPLVLVPATQAGVQDKRGRFREIYCAVLQARAGEVPDHRPCDDALTRLGTEPAGTGQPVPLGMSSRRLVAAVIPGIGWDCFAKWLQPPGTVNQHVSKYGYELRAIQVDALSSSAKNARQIRDAVMAMDLGAGAPRLVLVGYSKGTPDALEALVNHPEIRPRLAAVVSVAGAVGGSPLANDAEQYQADLLRHFPGATCDSGDGGGVADLRTGVRRSWLAQNPLPSGVPTYSLVTLPQPERISSILRGSNKKVSMVDGRNDSQVIFYDQVIPGSSLVGYLNADHWAIAVPIARVHDTVGSLFVTQNAYPREAMMEAVLRFVEEDLAARGR